MRRLQRFELNDDVARTALALRLLVGAAARQNPGAIFVEGDFRGRHIILVAFHITYIDAGDPISFGHSFSPPFHGASGGRGRRETPNSSCAHLFQYRLGCSLAIACCHDRAPYDQMAGTATNRLAWRYHASLVAMCSACRADAGRHHGKTRADDPAHGGGLRGRTDYSA